jgi:glycosyltransferase involved in cell wall biosynthesis
VSPSEPPSTTVEPGANPILTIASGSRLVHWKGFDLLVEAFARHLKGTDGLAKLLITGDGPFRRQLEDLIARLDISDSVRLLGHLPSRADVYRVVGSADLYALPTLRDGPPVAILEAMAAGRPILCLDRAATAEMVPIKAAFKIPVISRAQVVDDVARSLGWADNHRAELALMGREARKYALEHHDWRRIGRTIDAVYREVQSSRSADAPGLPDGST